MCFDDDVLLESLVLFCKRLLCREMPRWSRPFASQIGGVECFTESFSPGACTASPNHLSASRGTAVLSFMPVEQVIETEGKITSVLAGTMFRVELANKHLVLAHISGKMRKRFIRLTTGDRVKLEMSSYDLNKARIVYRLG